MHNLSFRVYIASFALVLACLAASAIATPVQFSGNGHLYEAVYVNPGLGWEAANSKAIAAGGNLAVVTTAEENDFIFSLIQDDKFWYIDGAGNGVGPWLGGWQLPWGPEPDGGWVWTTGEQFSYSNWAPGEPNDFAGFENRLAYTGPQTLKSDYWGDLAAGQPVRGYVVEYVPEPSSLLALLVGAGGLLLKRRR